MTQLKYNTLPLVEELSNNYRVDLVGGDIMWGFGGTERLTH